MSNKPIEELVEEAKAPGTFNIVNVLKERAYPREEVIVYLDEQAAYDAAKIQDKIDELTRKASLDVQDEIDTLIEKRDAIVESLKKNKYIFSVIGLSEGMREDLQGESAEKFPIEYDEEKNPFTGEIVKKERESKERDRLFTNLLWHSSIEKITSPDGSVQNNVTFEDINALREMLPIAAISAITQSIEKLRLSTAMFMMSVDEDFLAKS